MMKNEDVVMLNGIKVIALAPAHVAIVLDALGELPFKRANPVICSIMEQLKAQNPKAPDVGEAASDEPTEMKAA